MPSGTETQAQNVPSSIQTSLGPAIGSQPSAQRHRDTIAAVREYQSFLDTLSLTSQYSREFEKEYWLRFLAFYEQLIDALGLPVAPENTLASANANGEWRDQIDESALPSHLHLGNSIGRYRMHLFVKLLADHNKEVPVGEGHDFWEEVGSSRDMLYYCTTAMLLHPDGRTIEPQVSISSIDIGRYVRARLRGAALESLDKRGFPLEGSNQGMLRAQEKVK